MGEVFVLLHKYLQSQIYSPYLKSQVRVFVAKDIRAYRLEHRRVMQQVIAKSWPNNIQKVKIEHVVLKKLCKIVVCIITLLVLGYSLI